MKTRKFYLFLEINYWWCGGGIPWIARSFKEVDENKIFILDVNLVLFKKKINATKKVEFKFGINYTNGSDPTNGFDKQEITTYSFKLKI